MATIRHGDVAIAVRRRDYSDAEVDVGLERGERLSGLAAAAREHGHELTAWLRQDDESIAVCTRCTAHVYVRTSGAWVVDQKGLWELCEGIRDGVCQLYQYLGPHNGSYRARRLSTGPRVRYEVVAGRCRARPIGLEPHPPEREA